MNARPLPDAWRDEWTRELARPAVDLAPAATLAALAFRLGRDWYSVAAANLVEVSEVSTRHRVPGRPAASLVNVRGRVTVCADLHLLLHAERQPSGERLLVMRHEDRTFAASVDEVDRFHAIAAGDLAPPPAPTGGLRFVAGLWFSPRASVAHLDTPRLFAALTESLA